MGTLPCDQIRDQYYVYMHVCVYIYMLFQKGLENPNQPLIQFLPPLPMAIPQSLVEAQGWAHYSIAHALGDKADEQVLLWSKETLGFSSSFSGMCFPERALQYLGVARKALRPDLPLLSVTWSYLWAIHMANGGSRTSPQ